MTDPLLLRDEADEALAYAVREAKRYLAELDESPVLPDGAAQAADGFAGGLPATGDGALAALTELVEDGLGAATRSSGPRFFHFVTGGVTPAAQARTGSPRPWIRTRSRRSARRSRSGWRPSRSRGCWSCSSCRRAGAACSRPVPRPRTSRRWRQRAAGGRSGTASTWTIVASRASPRCRSSPAAMSTRARRRRWRCSVSDVARSACWPGMRRDGSTRRLWSASWRCSTANRRS